MFRFPLQRVLDLRERQQRDAAAALAAAQDAADAARRAEAAILSARVELAAAGFAPAGAGAPVGALRTTAFLVGRLDAQAEAAGAVAEAAAAAVSDREHALHAAYRDRRALDRLRERHHTTWQAGAVAADRQQMDEIALTRFTQRAVRPAGGV
ncbi:hypothetical protein tb265_17870 [Gemmatimonadetes bacterium T265]|nr:hypothetical protein tb265_17870 [Gemmatimonadetes bacterium T265]